MDNISNIRLMDNISSNSYCSNNNQVPFSLEKKSLSEKQTADGCGVKATEPARSAPCE